MSSPIKLTIHGASGRNGKRLIALGSVDPQFELVGAVVRKTSKHLGQDAGTMAGIVPIGFAVDAHFPSSTQCVIDFSSPEGSQHAIAHCVAHKIPLVIASTGLDEGQIANIAHASKVIPICYAPNMSVAVNLAMKLVENAARALRTIPGGADVEIIERHHRFKEDSPSGTALKFGQIVASAMGQTNHVHGREGQVGERRHNEIGYHAVRVGDDPGQHTILFGMMGEIIELRVGASNRDCYATGALTAAKYLIGKPASQYSMWDVLGI